VFCASVWRLIAAVLVLSTLAALGASLLTTAKYAASTQLFVSTTAQGAAAAYEGGLFSQQRVTSYSQLIQGGQVAPPTSTPSTPSPTAAASSPEPDPTDTNLTQNSGSAGPSLLAETRSDRGVFEAVITRWRLGAVGRCRWCR